MGWGEPDQPTMAQLQARLDARAADLGRFTQAAVRRTKHLEAAWRALEAISREAARPGLVDAPWLTADLIAKAIAAEPLLDRYNDGSLNVEPTMEQLAIAATEGARQPPQALTAEAIP